MNALDKTIKEQKHDILGYYKISDIYNEKGVPDLKNSATQALEMMDSLYQIEIGMKFVKYITTLSEILDAQNSNMKEKISNTYII